MTVEKYILAIVTTNPKKALGSTAIFVCDNKEEMEHKAANLEAILDGIAHELSDDLYIIVKH
ncbi:capping complex subunit for YIEGIA [Calidifontibacillus erzurumensis]|uniref:capping complex subunit for YIEGIA n=1 Tax=Calidifontibacillus erzurumensis TaxID=2741433 RepID=UPI0035B54166